MRSSAALLVLLASCATTASVTTTTTSPAPQNIAQFTAADLANAISIAKASNAPQASLIVNCFTFLQTQLAALQSPPTESGETVGIATAFVVADLAAGNLANTISPTSHAAYAVACGPLVTFTVNQGMSLGAQVSALAVILK